MVKIFVVVNISLFGFKCRSLCINRNLINVENRSRMQQHFLKKAGRTGISSLATIVQMNIARVLLFELMVLLDKYCCKFVDPFRC